MLNCPECGKVLLFREEEKQVSCTVCDYILPVEDFFTYVSCVSNELCKRLVFEEGSLSRFNGNERGSHYYYHTDLGEDFEKGWDSEDVNLDSTRISLQNSFLLSKTEKELIKANNFCISMSEEISGLKRENEELLGNISILASENKRYKSRFDKLVWVTKSLYNLEIKPPFWTKAILKKIRSIRYEVMGLIDSF